MRALCLLLLVSLAAAADLAWSAADRAAIATYTAAARQDGATWIVDRPLVVVRADVSADFAAAAARHHEVLWAWIHRHLELTPPPRPPRATLRIAGDREGYQADLGSETWSRGWYRWQWGDGKLREHCLYTFIEFPRERDFNRFYHPILVHETVHLVLQAHASEHALPELLNEGVATYLQSFNPFAHADVLPLERRSAYARKADLPIPAAELPSLLDLLHAQPWDIDDFGVQTHRRYVCAEMLVEYLHSTPEGRADLRSMLGHALRGIPLAPRFRGVRGERIAAGWREYLLLHQEARR